MLLTIVINLVLIGPTFETPTKTEEALAQGIIFHKEGKILITEKFINAEFLVPFPRYNFTIRQVETLLLELPKKWITVRILQHDLQYHVSQSDRCLQC